MAQSLKDALQAAELYSDGLDYRFVKMSPKVLTAAAGVIAELANPFTALLLDKDEITLMLQAEDYEEYQHRLLGHTVSPIVYRLLTLDVELEPTLIGFMAVISRALADAKISILPFAAFSRDHLFVANTDFDKAIHCLNELKNA